MRSYRKIKKMKIKSEKLKSLLVIIGFFILLSICFYKNLESNIKEIYRNNQYSGEVRITGFSLTSETKLVINANYTYSETINGKVISIPLKKQMMFEQVILPYYPPLAKEGRFGLLGDSIGRYSEPSSTYVPILEKALEINPERKKLEQELKKKIDQNSSLRGSKVELKLGIPSNIKYIGGTNWLEDYEKQSVKNGSTVLGGWYGFPVKEALDHDVLYVQVILPKGVKRDHIRFKDELKAIVQKSNLPNGTYVLGTVTDSDFDKVEIEDRVVKERD